jgi:phage-related protein (TIGR01555 family)
MAKTSIRGAVRDATRADIKARKQVTDQMKADPLLSAATFDGFINLAHKLGVGADNVLSSSTYGFNPITRNRQLLEWIHRGSWIGGQVIDVVADDMTRAGVDLQAELPPQDETKLMTAMRRMGVWEQINEVIKWSRLYGGAICVALIDGQDPRTPLNLDSIGPGQFKGLLTLDRWMVDPAVEDLVTQFGPHLGLPRFYRVQPNAPALRGEPVHYSRVMFRLEGVRAPYQQRLTENLWGISVLERMYDRMLGFDSATTGAAQLVHKAHLRTLKVKGLRDLVAAGGKPLAGFYAYVDNMRRFQGIEGLSVVDGDDEFDAQQTSSFSGLSDALIQFGQQLSGATQIPLVRLFGQSPAGLNSTGESDLRTYYDHINQRQERDLHAGTLTTHRLMARSQQIMLPPDFDLSFTALWQLSAQEKGELANKTGGTVQAAYDGGLIGRQTALKELRQQSRITNVFSNISAEMIAEADDEVVPPGGEGMEGMGLPGMENLLGGQNEESPLGPNGAAGGPADGPRRRVKLQEPAAPGSKASGSDDPDNGQRPNSGRPNPADPQRVRRPLAPLGGNRS